MADKDRKFETPKILHDWPLKNEQAAYFNFDDFAITLSRLVASKETDTPLTIGISGRWGAGKTTLLRRVEKMLDQTTVLYDPSKPAIFDFCSSEESPQALFRPCRTVWFNAWKYADEEQLLVALIRVIVQEMAQDDLVSKALGKLLDPAYPRRNVVATVLSWFSVKVADVGVELNTGEPKETRFGEKTATLDLFNEAFDRLLAAWVRRSLDAKKVEPEKGVLVVFVDDLDRCLPPKMVQVLEAVKLFLDKEGCVFVLGADTEIVRQAIEKQYEAAGVKGQSAADYLEKIMQLRFELPPSTHDDMQDMLNGEKIIGADWGDTWRLLITGAEINPRKVKTFVNDLNLQWAMLANTQQAQGVNRADFNAWQVLMRAAPPNFIRQVRDRLDDVDLRYSFVMDAIKWARGDETLKATFQEYESWRMQRVLRDIAFSADFTPQVLDAFIHLTAPPEKPAEQKVTPKIESATSVEDVAERLKKIESERVEEQPEPFESEEAVSFDVGAEPEPEFEETVKGTLRGIPEMGAKGTPRQPSRADAHIFAGMEFMRIPAGKFIMGSKDDDRDARDNEKPQHTVEEIPYDYWMARFLLTNARYAEYCQVKGNQHPVKDWKKEEDHPVVLVSWQDAMRYVAWLNEAYIEDLPQGFVFRLPSEAEWEKAARGVYGNTYPWGNVFDKNKCNSFEIGFGTTTPVGLFSPTGDSPYGCADMSGNVWEWTHSLMKTYPYNRQIADEQDNVSPKSARVYRGGSFFFDARFSRCACRDWEFPHGRDLNVGFRVALAPALG